MTAFGFEAVPAGTLFECTARAGVYFGKTLEVEVQTDPAAGTNGFQDYRYRVKGRKKWTESMAQARVIARWKAGE